MLAWTLCLPLDSGIVLLQNISGCICQKSSATCMAALIKSLSFGLIAFTFFTGNARIRRHGKYLQKCEAHVCGGTSMFKRYYD